jgi:hypothetical protein
MRHALLGPAFSDREIARAAARAGLAPRRLGGTAAAAGEAARRLAAGQIGGWFQGRMEWGPRALGGRSIVADPRRPDMQRRLNLRTKFREGFRPFAPAVLEEDAASWFEAAGPSPYMLFTAAVQPARRTGATAVRAASWQEQLAVPRSAIPAVTHVDLSARLQTVSPDHPAFRGLLEAFRDLTGCPVLINTSFNVRGEPIVRSPEDALGCFLRTDMDFLVMGDHLFVKDAVKEGGDGAAQGSVGLAQAPEGVVALAAAPGAPPPGPPPGRGGGLAARARDLLGLLSGGPPGPPLTDRRRLEALLSLTLVLLALSLILDATALAAAGAVPAMLALAAAGPSRSLATAWLALTRVLGRGVSNVLLTLVYLAVVTPAGLLRRALGATPRPLRRGGDDPPALDVREHAWGPDDLLHPW